MICFNFFFLTGSTTSASISIGPCDGAAPAPWCPVAAASAFFAIATSNRPLLCRLAVVLAFKGQQKGCTFLVSTGL